MIKRKFKNGVYCNDAPAIYYGGTTMMVKEKDDPDQHILIDIYTSQHCCEDFNIFESAEGLKLKNGEVLGPVTVVYMNNDSDPIKQSFINKYFDKETVEIVLDLKSRLSSDDFYDSGGITLFGIFKSETNQLVNCWLITNDHNGYYAHDITIDDNGEYLYEEI